MIISTKQVVKVDVLPFEMSPFYTYKEEIKILGIRIRDGGFYTPAGSLVYAEEIDRSRYQVNSTAVYIKPRITVELTNGYIRTLYYDTLKDAEYAYNTLKQNLKSNSWAEL